MFFAFHLWYWTFFLLYSSLFIWSAYVSPIQLAVSPLLFLCSHLPACPYSRFSFFFFFLLLFCSVLFLLSVLVHLCWHCLCVRVCLCSMAGGWQLFTKTFFSLWIFSLSRIPFREDPPPDIIPPSWAGRWVLPQPLWEPKKKTQSCLAAETHVKPWSPSLLNAVTLNHWDTSSKTKAA